MATFYVDLAAAGAGHAGTSGDPFSWADLNTRMNAGSAAPGDWYKIKGSISLTASAAWTNDGTAASPIVFEGVDASWGSLAENGRSSSNKTLNVTSYPTISTSSSSYTFGASGSTFCVFSCIDFTSTFNGATANMPGQSVIWRCRSDNTGSGGNASAFQGNVGTVFIDCDAALSSTGTPVRGAFYAASAWCKFIGCRCTGSSKHGFFLASNYEVCAFCVCEPVTADAFCYEQSANAYLPLLLNCTSYDAGGNAVSISNAAHTGLLAVVNCLLTAATTGINNLYSGTGNMGVAVINCALQNDTETTGITDWLAATNFGAVTPTTETSEYVEAATDNFNLATDAVSKAVGVLKYTDIGALQREEAAGGGGGTVDLPDAMIVGA